MTRRRLVLAALVLVVLTSATGVESVSTVTADRNVSVAVAPDDEAYLGIEFGEVDNGTRTLIVSNHVSTDSVTVTVASTSKEVGPGDRATFDVACDSTVTISADGSMVTVEATRAVEC